MSKYERGNQGHKTQDRQREILESDGKFDDSRVPSSERIGKTKTVDTLTEAEKSRSLEGKPGRQSAFPVSRGGMNQESRQHNKS